MVGFPGHPRTQEFLGEGGAGVLCKLLVHSLLVHVLASKLEIFKTTLIDTVITH